MSDSALNITLSVGDVSFHLAPSSDHDPSPRSRNGASSPYHAVNRRRQQQRKKNMTSPHEHATTPLSPPIVTIRRGASHSTPTSYTNLSPTTPSSPQSINSPLHQHILGRVRAIKDKIECDVRRNSSGAAVAQSPFSPTGAEGDYCVDLSSFTGTLHITTSKNPESMQNTYKAINSPRHTSNGSIVALSKKRKKSSIFIPSNESTNHENDDGTDERVCDYFDGQERADSALSQRSTNDSKKAVRFSILHQDSIINPSVDEGGDSSSPPSSEEENDVDSNVLDSELESLDKENDDPNSANITIGNGQSPPQPMEPQKAKSKHFFSSPPRTFSSPPRAAVATAKASMNIARETSSLLSRSSKHVLKQITLAGKDVYDVLNGGDVDASTKNASSNTNQGTSTPRRSVGSLLDSSDNNYVYDAFDGSELHYACGGDSLSRLRCLLENVDSLNDLHKEDCEGKLPIHVLTENQNLIIQDPLGCEEVAFTMMELMGPEKAVQALHPCGLSPFVNIIGSWTEKLHEGVQSRNISAVVRSDNTAVTRRTSTPSPKPSSQPTAAQSDEENQRSITPVTPSSMSNNAQTRRRIAYRSLFTSSKSTDDRSLTSSTDRAKLLYIPVSVTISDHVRWAIRILSRLIDEYPEQTREAILTNIASVPLFLKCLLLTGDSGLLDMSTLVKHTIMDKRSINVWLYAMLTDSKRVKDCAVIFLKVRFVLLRRDIVRCTMTSSKRCFSCQLYRNSFFQD